MAYQYGWGPVVEAWYCAGFARNAESLAIQNLEHQNYRVFCPRFLKIVSHARKKTQKLAALFPGYLFIQLELERQRWRPIDGTLGVTRIIKTAGRPARVDQSFVEKLLSVADPSGRVAFEEPLNVGDDVRVVGGPMDDQVASLCRMVDADRVVLLMSMLGRTVEVTMPRRHLIKAS